MPNVRFRYQTIEFDSHDIHIRSLRDKNQFSDRDGEAEELGISSASWPIFGLLWDSGSMLAELMHEFEAGDKRILEVGCGLALASHVLNHKNANITATDYHPEVKGFLDANSELNNHGKIPFVRTGWADETTKLGLFDVIIGSDLLYEQEHVELLSEFINRHAKPQCQLFIIDAGRGFKNKFSNKMQQLDFDKIEEQTISEQAIDARYKYHLLKFERKVG